MTTGVINKRMLELRGSTRIIELTIQGFCPVLKVQTVREPGSSIQSLVTKAGLCGGNEGTELDVKELPSRLERVTTRSSSAIDSLNFLTLANLAGDALKVHGVETTVVLLTL